MPKKKTNKKEADNAKTCAILAYLLVGIIWYFADKKLKKSQFAKFHVKQALVLLIVSVAVSLISSIQIFFGWVFSLLNILVFILWLFGIIYAAQGQEKEIPVIGQFAKKLTF